MLMLTCSSVVLSLTFTSVIHFESVFVKHIWSLCLVLSFACESLVAPALFVEEVVFAPACIDQFRTSRFRCLVWDLRSQGTVSDEWSGGCEHSGVGPEAVGSQWLPRT